MIAHMFDSLFRGVSDTGLLGAIEEFARAEAAAAARRLAATAELVRRRCDDEDTATWSCDAWDSAAAEVAAALNVSHGRASRQMQLAESLRLRLPRIAELFLAGAVSARVVAAIAWRIHLVTDDDAMALIDRALADRAGGWDALSQYKLEQAIDTWIDKHDRARCAAPAPAPAVAMSPSAPRIMNSVRPPCGAGSTPPTQPHWTAGSPQWRTASAMTIPGPSVSGAPMRSAPSRRAPNSSRASAELPAAPSRGRISGPPASWFTCSPMPRLSPHNPMTTCPATATADSRPSPVPDRPSSSEVAPFRRHFWPS